MVPSRAALFVFGCVVAVWCAQPALSQRYIGRINSTNIGFINVGTLPGQPPNLIISGFTGNPFAKDSVSVVPDLAAALINPNAVTPTVINTDLVWPNEANSVPENAISGFTGYIVANGFLVPPKDIGSVSLLETDAAGTSVKNVYQLTQNKGNKFLGGWFYHKAVWVDMNGDGLLDVVTARATKPIVGSPNGEFVWLEQPSSDPLSADNLPWQEHSLASGHFSPDVFFEPFDINGDGEDEFLFASFFTGGGFGVLSSTGSGATRWTEPSTIHISMIDTGLPLLNGFSLSTVDLNNDGKLDVLFTNHVDNSTQKGAISQVIAFETPPHGSNFSDPANWQSHVLTSGFLVREFGFNQAAPGFAKAFHPIAKTASKPMIVVEGDGDQRVYLLRPASTDPSDWTYTRAHLWDCQGTAAALVTGDLTGDGFTEILAGCYDKSYIAVFTFRP